MSVDGDPRFEYRMDGFTHDLSRCCDAVSHYPMQLTSRNEVIRLAQLAESPDCFYPVMRERGLVRTAEGEKRRIRIEAEDDCGNRSQLEFDILGRTETLRAEADSTAVVLRPEKVALVRAGRDLTARIPAGAVYEPIFCRPEQRQAPASDSTAAVLSPAYRILGAHPWQGDHGEEGWRFAVWAPGAAAVEVCGGFDGWGAGIPLQKADTGVWSGFVSGLCEGELYKYRIHGADGSVVMRADPYAFASEVRPANASRLTKLDFSFDDSAWMERRDKCRNLPMNIYELHAGSWKHKPNSTQPDGSDGWYDYEELARELIPWLLEHHFTHVELLPLAEHPFDGSWGYQTTGYFAVTSRYGTPAQFASLGIGVIMDFVPVHFAANADALANFDGTHLYEYDSDVGHSEWGTCNFNYYRREVCSFLNSAAALWMEVYHCDGIRPLLAGRPCPGRQRGRRHLPAEPQPRPERALAHRHLHGRGLHQLPQGDSSHPLRRRGLRLQVGHGLDARHTGLFCHPLR